MTSDLEKTAIERTQSIPEGDGEINTVLQGARRDYTGAMAKINPEEVRLVRKLDSRIMPTLCIMYFLNYIDRNAIASARLNHLEKDLKMAGTDFNTAVSILFVGYVLMQIPSNMLITRVRPSIYMSICMMVWAVVSACTSLVKSYAGLVVCRFLLGFTEAPFYPGATYMLSMFYTRKEVAARIAVLYCAQILATGFSSLISAGVFAGLDHDRGIKGWQWLFIIEGSITAFIAIGGMWFLPDTPSTTRWLTPEERKLAHSRMESEKIGNQGISSTMEGLKQAFKDKRTWIFCLMQNFHHASCSFNSFFPTVVKTLGFNTTITLVMTCPPFICAACAVIIVGWSSGHFHERTWHITVCYLIAIVGFCMAASSLGTAVRYTALFIFPIGAYSANAVIIGWAATTLSQTNEKKSVVLAMTNVAGQIGYIYGAYLWPKSDDPRYAIGFGTSAGFSVLGIITAWCMRILLKRTNRRASTNSACNDGNFYGY